jgi:hypothetical protein
MRPATGVPGDLAALLRLGGFRRLLAVRLLSQLADGVYQVALAAYVVFTPEKETSAGAVAAALAVLLLPYSLLGPFTGVLLDRWRRRQVLLLGNVLRAVLSGGTALLVVAHVPDGLFYLSALSVTAVNRFVLAGLSAALPRVVDGRPLVVANALTPTAGTLAATLGGGVAFVVRITVRTTVPGGGSADAAVVLMGALLYLAAGLSALSLGADALGGGAAEENAQTSGGAGGASGVAGAGLAAGVWMTVRGLGAGLRHLRECRAAGEALAAMTAMRFCYGALTVTLLMLCRYGWAGDAGSGPGSGSGSGSASGGLALLGVAVAVSGAGFLAAALVTPSMVARLGALGWITACAVGSAVLLPVLGLGFAVVPMLVAAFFLGVATQGAKIATDTVVQAQVSDAFRGRVFSLYDVLFNVGYVAAAAVTALVLPRDGRSPGVLLALTALYAGVAWSMFHVKHRTPPDTTPSAGPGTVLPSCPNDL